MKSLSQKSIDLVNLSQKAVDGLNEAQSKLLSTLQDSIFNKAKGEYESMCKDRNSDIETILRKHVEPPIKGLITDGKLRWRGINSIIYGEGLMFRGIEQRGYLIDANGNKTKLKPDYVRTKNCNKKARY